MDFTSVTSRINLCLKGMRNFILLKIIMRFYYFQHFNPENVWILQRITLIYL